MGAVVLDSSVVIALFDPADAHHAASTVVVGAVWDAEDDVIMPASVLSEVMVAAYRHDPASAVVRLEALDAAFGPPRAVDREVAVRAAELRGRHRGLRLPDALVLAVGQVDEVDRVLTADKRWVAVDGRVEVVGACGCWWWASGAREHALCLALAADPAVDRARLRARQRRHRRRSPSSARWRSPTRRRSPSWPSSCAPTWS